MLRVLLYISFFVSLISFTPILAFADNDVNPCSGASSSVGTGSKAFQDSLCGLQDKGPGAIIRNSIIAVLVIATLISLFFLIRGGITWIMSGGDKGKVDAARQMLVASVVGLIVSFLAFFILSLVLQLFGLGFDNLSIPNITGNGTTPAGAGFTCPPGTSVVTDDTGVPQCI